MTHTILVGDAREQLASLPDQSVQCCVTSPPYWNLRDYGHPDQIGNEPTVEQYVENLVSVFREVRRVLRDDGVLFLNLGDTYVAPRGNTAAKPGYDHKAAGGHAALNYAGTKPTGNLKTKDLIGVPWMVAFALRADGWYLRSEIIWAKPNPMPESVTDRPTKSHEQIFLLSKSPRYFYDASAIAEPVTLSTVERLSQPNLENQTGSARIAGREDRPMKAVRGSHKGSTFHRGKTAAHQQNRSSTSDRIEGDTRNKRSVWTVSTKPYGDAHFAVFPREIPETCIKAGTSERGQCRECGAPWVRVVERGKSTPDLTQRSTAHYNTADRYGAKNGGNSGFDKLAARMRAGENGQVTTGWAPSCGCDAGDPVPQTVLDPFAGSGTTGEVAEYLGRRVILIELNPAYVPLIEKRLAQRTIWDALSIAD